MNNEELKAWINANNASFYTDTVGMNGYTQCFNTGLRVGFEEGCKLLNAEQSNHIPDDWKIRRIFEIFFGDSSDENIEECIKEVKEHWNDENNTCNN